MREEKSLSLRRALLYISLSVILISGSATLLHWWRSQWMEGRKDDPNYQLKAIVQTGPERRALPTRYFAELLDLSVDHPVNLYALDLEEVAERLRASPLLARVKVGRLGKEALLIDYTARHPVAMVADCANCAVDSGGNLFPLHPFYTPKILPELYTGMEPRAILLALEVLERLQSSPFSELSVERIDTSNAFSLSWGRREIVLRTAQGHLLRLGVEEYEKGLYNYLLLRDAMQDKGGSGPQIVDLRIGDLAFVCSWQKEVDE